MKVIKVMNLILLVLGTFLLISCAPTQKQCEIDSDCVPAVCCHATDAVNKNFGPDCTGLLCTMDCTPGTLDCGQADLRCVSGECTVVLR